MAIAAVAIAGAVISAASSIKGGIDGQKGAAAAKSAGKQQAKMIQMEGQEQERRLKRTQQAEYKTSVAKSYASNLQMSGSTESYLHDMRSEQMREIDWLKSETAARSYAAKKGANVAASNLRSTSTTNMMASLGSLALKVGV